MAMTLRLTSEETAALRRQAEAEQHSMQDVARRAVVEYVERHAHRARVDAALDFATDHYRKTLDYLADR